MTLATYDFANHNFTRVYNEYRYLAAEQNKRYRYSKNIKTDLVTLEEIMRSLGLDTPDSQGTSDESKLGEALYSAPELLYVYSYKSSSFTTVNLEVATDDIALAAKFLEELGGRIPPATIAPDEYSLTIWNEKDHSGVYRSTKITVPRWMDIAPNYSTEVRDSLDNLFDLRPPFDQGRIVLMSGPPGTGKTFAIRALADAWRDWADFHYILDPDNFLRYPDYTLLVSFHDSEKWRVLILEDSDEVITVDAKARAGQSLSKLLSLGDGLLGQGLRQLILITTNEPIHELHPAVKREGRCIAEIKLDSLPPAESERWLTAHGYKKAPPRNDCTLAELYSLLRTQQKIEGLPAAKELGTYL